MPAGIYYNKRKLQFITIYLSIARMSIQKFRSDLPNQLVSAALLKAQ